MAARRPHSAQARATASDCRCAVIAPLLRPVVPEVNRMSLTSPGRTAAARLSAALAGTASARASRSAQPITPAAAPFPGPGSAAPGIGTRTTSRSCPGRAGPATGERSAAVSFRGGAARHAGGISFRCVTQGVQPVGPEEPVGDDQYGRAAPGDHVERLGPGEPGADRDQRGTGGQRAERGKHPVMRVRGPDRHTVPGGHALGHQRPRDNGALLMKLVITDPRAPRLGEGGPVAELPRRSCQSGRDGEVHQVPSNEASAW